MGEEIFSKLRVPCECEAWIGVTFRSPRGGQTGQAHGATIECPNCQRSFRMSVTGPLVGLWLAGAPDAYQPVWNRFKHKLNAVAVQKGRLQRFEVVHDQRNDMFEVVYDRVGADRRKRLHGLEVGKLLRSDHRGDLVAFADSLLD